MVHFWARGGKGFEKWTAGSLFYTFFFWKPSLTQLCLKRSWSSCLDSWCYRVLYSIAALSNLPRPSSSLPSPSWSIGENNPISQINLSCSPQSWGNGIPLVYCGYCHLLPGDNQSGQQVGTIETRANNAQTNGPHNPKFCQLMIQTLAKSWRPVCSCLL